MSMNATLAARTKWFGPGVALLAAGVVAAAGMSGGARVASGSEPPAIESHEAPVPQAPDGRKIFLTSCSACHQGDGTGVPGAFPPLAGSDWVTGDEGRLVRVILHGLTGPIEVNGEGYAGTMPPFGGALSNADVAAVATYIRASWGNEAPQVTVADVARIRRISQSRMGPWTAAELDQVSRGDG
jgi:mono/diheme cytochrome c family protein